MVTTNLRVNECTFGDSARASETGQVSTRSHLQRIDRFAIVFDIKEDLSRSEETVCSQQDHLDYHCSLSYCTVLTGFSTLLSRRPGTTRENPLSKKKKRAQRIDYFVTTTAAATTTTTTKHANAQVLKHVNY